MKIQEGLEQDHDNGLSDDWGLVGTYCRRRGITAEQHMRAIREDREAEHNYRAMRAAIRAHVQRIKETP